MEKLVYVTNYSSTASGPPSLTREGFCKSRFWAIDGGAFCTVTTLDSRQLVAGTHLSLQSKKMTDGCAAVTVIFLGSSGRRPLPYHFSLFSLHSSLFSSPCLPPIIHYSLFNIHYSLLFLYPLGVLAGGGFGLVVAVLVVALAHKIVGQILLLNVMSGVAMRILIALE